MIPKLKNAAKHPVTPSSWKPSTDTSGSPTTPDFTPAETPTKSSGSNHQTIRDIDATGMEETTEGATPQQEGKTPESEDTKAKEDTSSPKPDITPTPKESKSTKTKKTSCKKHAKDAKKKTKKHSKAVEANSSSDSDDSSSNTSSSSSSDDSSDSSSEDDEAAKKKRKSKAKAARKLKAKKKAKAKAKLEDSDSDSDDESSSSEEEKKKSKKRKQLKKKKRAKKSKEVEEEDDEEGDDDDDDAGDAALNKQQLAQLRAMNLKQIGRGRAGRGTTGEIVNVSGELGKKNAKAKGKPGKRSVFRKLSSIKLQKNELRLSSFATSIIKRFFRSDKRRTSSQSSRIMLPCVNVNTYHFLLFGTFELGHCSLY